MRKLAITAMLLGLLAAAPLATAKIDLVTLPEREATQLTIYNSADLTLVRDSRPLTLKTGQNSLQFSWANTLIDPTSLDMLPLKNADRIDIHDITYPPRVRNVGLWHISSEVSGQVPVEITYFTSGLSWRAYYIATLSEDESEMEIKGYVKVINSSGEDYENAQVRLVVGEVTLLDRIAELARRASPYADRLGLKMDMDEKGVAINGLVALSGFAGGAVLQDARKVITKQALADYQLYTIEGTETIPNGWAKRLQSFAADEVKVENLYKFEEERYGPTPVRFLFFKNDEEHNLGETPLPEGMINVFRTVSAAGNLSYVGADSTKYIPLDQKVELNLGAARKVEVEPKLMEFKKENLIYGRNREVTGFDDVREYVLEIKNYSSRPIQLEITRNVDSVHWELTDTKTPAPHEKVDQDTFKYTLTLEPRSEEEISHRLRIFRGERENRR